MKCCSFKSLLLDYSGFNLHKKTHFKQPSLVFCKTKTMGVVSAGRVENFDSGMVNDNQKCPCLKGTLWPLASRGKVSFKSFYIAAVSRSSHFLVFECMKSKIKINKLKTSPPPPSPAICSFFGVFFGGLLGIYR